MFESMATTLVEMGEASYLPLASVPLWTLALLLFGFVLMRRARRKRSPDVRFTYGPEALALVVVVTPLFAVFPAWQAPPRAMRLALMTADPSEKATALAAGLSTQLHATSFLGLMLLTTTAIASILFAVFVLQRHARAPRHVAFSAALGAGLIASTPSAFAVWVLAHVRAVIATFGAVATAAPDNKGRLLRAGLDEAAPLLDTGLVVAALWLVVGVGLATYAVFARREPVTRPAFQFAGAGLFAAAAVVLVVETTPFAGENAMPIPQSKGAASEIDISDSTPPELTGPDDVPRAGVISVSADRVRIEGESVADLDALSARLGELRRVDQLMRPEEPFTGRLVVIVDRDVRGARLAGVAEAVKRAGYVEWSLVLSVRGETQERPLLGTQRALNTTSVRVHVDGHEGAERVTVAPDERFDDLARRLVDLRQGGREVALVFGP